MVNSNALSSSASTSCRTPQSSTNKWPAATFTFRSAKCMRTCPLQLLNGDPPLCSVLAHSCAALHQNQNDSEVRIFRERFGTRPSCPLPGLFSPELLQLTIQVDSQQRFRQPGQSIQCFSAIAEMASAEIRSHDENLLPAQLCISVVITCQPLNFSYGAPSR